MALNYFNPNPRARVGKDGKPQKWHLGDCAVRAICAATGMSWIDAYKFASESALKVYEPFNCSKGFGQVMKDLGFIKVSYGRGETRETVSTFARTHKSEIAILSLAGHYVCCRDGAYWDVFDCGDSTAYNYWVLRNPGNK